MAKDTVTINDIAQRAGVSISTVSRVLRGTTPVSEAKRTAVLDAVAALDYQPNVFAQGLASGQSMAVGVLTQNFGSPFYDTILQGVVRGLHESGYFPIFADGEWNMDRELEAIAAMMQRKIDGLIVLGGHVEAEVLSQYARQVPLVVVGRLLPQLEEQCLTIDNVQAAYTATHYLIELGHRRIAHIRGRADHPDADDRSEGYRQALLDAGIKLNPDLVAAGSFRRQSGVLAMDALLSRGLPFSAIFAANDQMAFGARLALHRRGIRVPDDVSLIGLDDEPAAAYMIPPLTTIRQPGVELGLETARNILARIKGESPAPARLTTELIVRESTAVQR
jgi:LacI family transcriptional regulator